MNYLSQDKKVKKLNKKIAKKVIKYMEEVNFHFSFENRQQQSSFIYYAVSKIVNNYKEKYLRIFKELNEPEQIKKINRNKVSVGLYVVKKLREFEKKDSKNTAVYFYDIPRFYNYIKKCFYKIL